jgi:hypothetical protein
MRVVMNDLRLDDIASIDPDEMFRQLREDRVSSGPSVITQKRP